jgi:hypothetical protein
MSILGSIKKLLGGRMTLKRGRGRFHGDAENAVLRAAAIDLSNQLNSVGASQNATRSVWYFQQSWNAAGVGSSNLNVDGLYTQDVNQALFLTLQNFGLPTSIPAAIL